MDHFLDATEPDRTDLITSHASVFKFCCGAEYRHRADIKYTVPTGSWVLVTLHTREPNLVVGLLDRLFVPWWPDILSGTIRVVADERA